MPNNQEAVFDDSPVRPLSSVSSQGLANETASFDSNPVKPLSALPSTNDDPFAQFGGKRHDVIGPQQSIGSQLLHDPGMPLRSKVREIENYTQEGRAEHPILSRVGDALKKVYEPSEVPNDVDHPLAQPVPPPLAGLTSALGAVTPSVVPTAMPPEIDPTWLRKLPEVPAAQHGVPLTVESPLDSATVGKQLGGKDLSQEALTTLQKHVGDKIPVGSTAKNTLMRAVEPVSKTITDTSTQLNAVVQNAGPFKTSVAQDGVIQTVIADIKKNLPPSVRVPLSEDVEGVMQDAQKALNSTDPTEVLEQRRILGKKIDWDAIEKNPSTPKEAQNLARVKVYHALGDKIHTEIPGTVPLDQVLQPNLELRSHMTSKLGERAVEDPQAATVEAQTEFRKGKKMLAVQANNARVARNQKIAFEALGIPAAGAVGAVVEHALTKKP